LSSGGWEWTQYVKVHATAQPERQLWTFPGALAISPYLLGPVYANPKNFTDQQQKLVSQRSSWRDMQHQMRRLVHIPQNTHVKNMNLNTPSIVEFLNDEISDDSRCAMQIFNRHGFQAWPGWMSKCRGRTLPDVSRC